jgi:hypothetical protein
VNAFQSLVAHARKNEAALGAAFFIAGFGFDMAAVGRIDSWHVIAQQAVYLALASAVLLQMLREEGGPPLALEGMGRLKRWYFGYRPELVSFLLGTLLNMYTLFFFKSSSLLVSFGFLAVLVALLLANESKSLRFLGLTLRFALLGLCFLCFAAAVVPIAFGNSGVLVFLVSMLAGAVPLAVAGAWMGASSPELLARVRRQVLVPLGIMVVTFLGFYLFRLVPPVPLSIPFIGVYHGVEKNGNSYWLDHERPAWRWWHNGDQEFFAQPGDKIYVYFRIFSPTRFSDEVLMRWQREEPGHGWTLQDTIPIKIVGGRELGFRGYGVKTHYEPGHWRVQVETTDGREIGRIYFTLENAPQEARTFTRELD